MPEDILSILELMPADGFRERLLQDILKRRTPMIATSIREGFQTVTPYLTVVEVDRMVGFLTAAFGAVSTHRQGGHAEVRIGDSMLMLGGGEECRGRENTGAFHLYVPDCDATFARAIDAGADSMGEPADRPYGERSGFVKDFAGNHWYIGTRFDWNPAPAGSRTVVPYAFPKSVHGFLDFLQRAFGAEQLLLHEEGGRVMHAAARVGDAVIEMGEPHDGTFLPSMFFMYVDDCDSVYNQALAAGATSKSAPADLPYGRSATVIDPFGYEWVPTSIANLK
jgi:PhnB protein